MNAIKERRKLLVHISLKLLQIRFIIMDVNDLELKYLWIMLTGTEIPDSDTDALITINA